MRCHTMPRGFSCADPNQYPGIFGGLAGVLSAAAFRLSTLLLHPLLHLRMRAFISSLKALTSAWSSIPFLSRSM